MPILARKFLFKFAVPVAFIKLPRLSPLFRRTTVWRMNVCVQHFNALPVLLVD